MNNFKIKNELNKHILEYKFAETDENDTFSEGMLKNNTIEGILPLSFQQIDSKKYYVFEINNNVSFKEYFSKPVTKNDLIDALKQIMNIYKRVSEYMIEEKYIVLDLEYMFMNTDTKKVSLVCLPIENISVEYNLGNFIKQFITGIVYQAGEESFIIQLLNFVNTKPNFTYDELLNLLNEINQTHVQSVKVEPVVPPKQPQPQPVRREQTVVREQPQPKKAPIINQEKLVKKEPSTPAPAGKCPHCGKPYEPGYKFCMACGKSLTAQPEQVKKVEAPNSDVIVCPSCGSNNKSDYLFCQICGTNLKTGEKKPAKKGLFSRNKNKNVKKVEKKEKEKKPLFAKKTEKKPTSSIPTKNKRKTVFTEETTQQAVNSNVQESYNSNISEGSFAGTTVLNSGNDTTVLSEGTTVLNANVQVKYPKLKRLADMQEVFVNKDSFKIGKDTMYNDYFVSNNSAISRRHAEILCENGKYYITDLNSTNHTYVEGNIVSPGYKVELHSGDTIKLADEEFIFTLD